MMNDECGMMNGGREDAYGVHSLCSAALIFIIHRSSFIIIPAVVLCLRTALADTASTRPSPLASRPSEATTRPSENLMTVSTLMSQAGERLGAGKPDGVTQASQRRAVEILDRLIEEAEKQESRQQQGQCKACGGKGCRLCRKTMAAAGGKPASPARQSTVSPGPGGTGELHPAGAARPGEAWGNMRPEEREKILQSLGKDFPSQYRQLVEQYYKQLAKEE